jgi:methyl-accepting chemotaxis protein
MTFKQRIQITFFALALLALGGAFISIRAAMKNFAGLTAMVENDVPNLARSQFMMVGAKDLRRYEKDLFLNMGAPEKQKGYLDKWTEVLATVHTEVDSLEMGWVDDQEQANQLGEIKKRTTAVRVALKGYEEGFLTLAQSAMTDSTMTPQIGNKKMGPFKEFIYSFETELDTLAILAMGHIEASTAISQERVRQAGWVNGIVVLVFLVGTIFSGGWLMRVFQVNYTRLAKSMQSLADGSGRLSDKVNLEGQDEMAQLGRWFNRLLDSIGGVLSELTGQSRKVSESSQSLLSESTQIRESSMATQHLGQEVSRVVAEATEGMMAVSRSSAEISNNISAVAAAIEEMSATVSEVTRNCHEESRIAALANQEVQAAKVTMERLGQAAQEIDKVLDVIVQISSQTNLLALNAAIEAASAGEAGKGFAVVATEVKALANKTTQSTGQIGRQISTMKQNTKDAVEAIGKVLETIDQVNRISQSIAAAMEEQSATSNEIARNINEANDAYAQAVKRIQETSTGLSSADASLKSVTDSASVVSSRVVQVTGQAQSLADLSKRLQELSGTIKA